MGKRREQGKWHEMGSMTERRTVAPCNCVSCCAFMLRIMIPSLVFKLVSFSENGTGLPSHLASSGVVSLATRHILNLRARLQQTLSLISCVS